MPAGDACRKPQEQHEQEDRERYRELLEELRVVLPGVQVLFAFLLTAPFSARFEELDSVGLNGYFVALISAALSTVMFMTPTSYHRIAPREDRSRRLRFAVRLTMGGMATLVLAIAAAVFVVTRFVFGVGAAGILAGGVLAAAGLLWYAIPVRRRLAN